MSLTTRFFIALFIGVMTSGVATAEGSINFDDADVVLKQQPILREYLLNSLCISNTGIASRLASIYPMGGKRLGPYELVAKPKAQAGEYTLKIIISTEQKFTNNRGKSVGPDKATQVIE